MVRFWALEIWTLSVIALLVNCPFKFLYTRVLKSFLQLVLMLWKRLTMIITPVRRWVCILNKADSVFPTAVIQKTEHFSILQFYIKFNKEYNTRFIILHPFCGNPRERVIYHLGCLVSAPRIGDTLWIGLRSPLGDVGIHYVPLNLYGNSLDEIT